MPNLDNIFNKFFPQSQTTKKGVFLLRMAWGVEILVAFIGLCVGILIIRGAQGVTDASDLAAQGMSLNDLTIGMIFIIVAVVELTKIPLATAVYYSVRLFWRIVFRHNRGPGQKPKNALCVLGDSRSTKSKMPRGE